ncbi:MAG: serine/threonine-protein kinase [Actinomycetota bacterium]
MIDEVNQGLDRGPVLQPREVIAAGYEVIEHLRRGKRLDVYDVWSVERACRCVAKAIVPDRLHEEKTRTKLIGEGELLMKLTHPNIVRAYDLVENHATHSPVLILETLTGRTVSHLIDEFEDEMELTDVAWLGIHLCSAVAYLHKHGILHLDVKPDNVISEAGRAKLLDLSISGREGSAAAGAGTYDYLAPEQARGEVVSAATDVWGIGITLYETLTGTVPFEPDEDDDDYEDDAGHEEERDDESDSMDYSDSSEYTDASNDFDPNVYPQATERAPSVATRRDGLPVALVEIIDACLEPEPRNRPTVQELAERLARVAGVDPRASS